jgi:acyl carrier protein
MASDADGAPTLDALRTLLTATLQLGVRGPALRAESALLGDLPELDSMAVVDLVAALEARFDLLIDDDDINAQTFATLGALLAMLRRKRPA